MNAIKERIYSYIRETLGIDDLESAKDLMLEYCATFAEYLTKIEQLVAAKDGAGLYRAAHSLKGCSGNVGHAQVSDLCLRLETAAQTENFSDAEEILRQLRMAADALRS